jgi:hypothetical protein
VVSRQPTHPASDGRAQLPSVPQPGDRPHRSRLPLAGSSRRCGTPSRERPSRRR